MAKNLKLILPFPDSPGCIFLWIRQYLGVNILNQFQTKADSNLGFWFAQKGSNSSLLVILIFVYAVRIMKQAG